MCKRHRTIKKGAPQPWVGGMGSLQTPRDLFGKLGRDLARLEADPANGDAAFDFFVTAFHLIDWIHPGDSREKERKKLVQSDQSRRLEIAGHIANAAKHFELREGRWDSVKGVRPSGGYWGASYWPRNWWPRNYWSEPRLIIELTATEAKNFGNRTVIDVLTVARDLHAYWREHPKVSTPSASATPPS